MSSKRSGWLVTGGAVVALVGVIVTIVYFFQPWRSCDYEDTSAGCAMLPTDATVMTVAAFVTLIAVALLIFALRTDDRRADRSRCLPLSEGPPRPPSSSRSER